MNAYGEGDIVLVKLGSDPYWPGIVSNCPWADDPDYGAANAIKEGVRKVYVEFYETYDGEWAAETRVKNFVYQNDEGQLGAAMKEAQDRRTEALLGIRGNRRSVFTLGDVVIAQVGCYPGWPAIIGSKEVSGNSPVHYNYMVDFLGNHGNGHAEFSLVPRKRMLPYSEENMARTKVRPICSIYTAYEGARQAAEDVLDSDKLSE